MSELRFSSEKEALQYLADKTGKKIKIAGVVPSMDEVGELLGGLDKVIKFYAETNTEIGREFTKLLNEKRKLGDRIIDALQKVQSEGDDPDSWGND